MSNFVYYNADICSKEEEILSLLTKAASLNASELLLLLMMTFPLKPAEEMQKLAVDLTMNKEKDTIEAVDAEKTLPKRRLACFCFV